MSLTAEQQRAISHSDGHLQLIACAGSGKTEVLARRVAHLLDPASGHGLGPANLVAFTFTEKAAAELKQRIVERTRERLPAFTGFADMFVGTIHAFCLELLKTEVPEFLKYEVLTEVQQVLFIDRSSKKSGLTTTKDLKGQPLKRYRDTSHYVTALSILREADIDASKLSATGILDGLASYDALLKTHHYLDYSSILQKAVAEIRTNEELRQRLAKRIRHVVVDEYQDVNPVQEELVRALAALGARICVVGDDDQTIYQWRGSDVENIQHFRKRYTPADQIRLEENFRSSEGVIDVARNFIEQNTQRIPKAMVPTNAQPYEKGDITALHFADPEEEAEFIAKTIGSLRGVAFRDSDKSERGLDYSDMAVLLRSVRQNAAPIADALTRAGIPFIIGGMNNLFETSEVQAARALFYFLAGRPDVPRAELERHWVEAGLGGDGARLQLAVANAEQVRAGLLEDADDKRWSYYNLQRSFLTFLETLHLREEGVPGGRGEVLFYNLGKFSQLISDFESINFKSEPKRKYEEFANFLQYGAEDAYPEGTQDNQFANPNAVRIMTVHQAKGMQWPAVFVPALMRNRFPSPAMGGRSVWHILDASGVAKAERFKGGVFDERRLFYVALTRSQKFLFMTWAPIEGKNNRYSRPSEFWENVLVSKYVKRKAADFGSRPRLLPQAKRNIANVTLSFSELKYFFECPYQFKLRILYGFNAPLEEALGYGKSVHDALAEVHARAIEGKPPTVSEVDRLVETHLHVPFAYPALRDALQRAAGKVIGDYFADNEALFPFIEFSEKRVEISLGDGVNVAGRIDLVRRLDTKETTIVDLKSTSRAQAEDVTDIQLSIYALGYQELTGRDADRVEIYNLDERKKKPRSVDEDLILEVKGLVKGAAAALRANSLPASAPASTCKKCDYRGLCQRGALAVAGSTGG